MRSVVNRSVTGVLISP